MPVIGVLQVSLYERMSFGVGIGVFLEHSFHVGFLERFEQFGRFLMLPVIIRRVARTRVHLVGIVQIPLTPTIIPQKHGLLFVIPRVCEEAGGRF